MAPVVIIVFAIFAGEFLNAQLADQIDELQPALLRFASMIWSFIGSLVIFIFVRHIVVKTFEKGVERPTKLFKSFGSYSVMALITLATFISAEFFGHITFEIFGGIYLWLAFLIKTSTDLTFSLLFLSTYTKIAFDTAFFVLFISGIATLAVAFINNEHVLKGTFASYRKIIYGRGIKTLIISLRFIHWIALGVIVIPLFLGMTAPLFSSLTLPSETLSLTIIIIVVFFFVPILWQLTLQVYVIASTGYYIAIPTSKQMTYSKKDDDFHEELNIHAKREAFEETQAVIDNQQLSNEVQMSQK